MEMTGQPGPGPGPQVVSVVPVSAQQNNQSGETKRKMMLRVVTLRSPRLKSRETSASEVANTVARVAREAGWECETGWMEELDGPGLKLEAFQSLIDPKPVTGVPELDALVRPMSLAQLSNLLRHREIVRRAAQDDNVADLTLVLEDDALRTEATPALLTRFFQAVERNAFKADIVFAGLPRVSENGQVRPNSLSLTLKDAELNDVELLRVQSSFLVLPSKESYFITRDGARAIWDHWKDKVSFRAAVQFSWTIAAKSLRAFYFSTNMFVDGSKLGYFAGTCTPNGALIYNAAYMGALATLQKSDRTPSDLDAAEKAIDGLAATLRHPQVLHQKGIIAFLRGDRVRARAVLLEACDLAIAEGACLDHTSELLNNAINACRISS